MKHRILTYCAIGMAAFAAAPTIAQTGGAQVDPAVVTTAVKVPEVAALQAPSERVGEFFETEDGARIFYEVAGDGPPMLLLQGYPLSGALFARVRDSLQGDHTVLTVDHRGYGLSEAPGIPDNVKMYAEDALAVMTHLGFDAAIIGGMPIGEPVALSMYEMSPERFAGMVLVDTSAAAAAPPRSRALERYRRGRPQCRQGADHGSAPA